MILREWRGRADYGREHEYPRHFRTRVVSELQQVTGFVNADLLQRDLGHAVAFTVITRWTSMDAVSAFAGSDPGKAVVEPGALDALRDFDADMSHHTVLEQVRGGTVSN